jgi:hypothetical protein
MSMGPVRAVWAFLGLIGVFRAVLCLYRLVCFNVCTRTKTGFRGGFWSRSGLPQRVSVLSGQLWLGRAQGGRRGLVRAVRAVQAVQA